MSGHTLSCSCAPEADLRAGGQRLGAAKGASRCWDGIGERGSELRWGAGVPPPEGPADVMRRPWLQARSRGFDEAAIAAFYVGIWNLFYSE